MNSSTFAQDLLASIVVFLVALPLCMGIAIASGVDPAMGLLSGIVGGLVVGVFAGSPLQVSGPAAGLAVIVGCGSATGVSLTASLAAAATTSSSSPTAVNFSSSAFVRPPPKHDSQAPIGSQ